MDSSYVPRSRQVATTSWSLGDWSASLSISRIGHVNYLEDTKEVHTLIQMLLHITKLETICLSD